MNKNLKLWNSVEKTDPKYTKEVNFGRKFTSINAHYQVKCMTEAFGQKGKGWGIKGEHFHMLVDGLLGYQAVMWYVQDDKHFEFDINSSIATHNRSGKLDDECYKKVTTDALTKGLSHLGFNADIFLGMWDDNRYVSQMKQEFSKKEETPKIPLKVNSENYKKVLNYIAHNKEREWNDVLEKFLTKYKITPAMKSNLKKLHTNG